MLLLIASYYYTIVRQAGGILESLEGLNEDH